jgi:hypothetical protein
VQGFFLHLLEGDEFLLPPRPARAAASAATERSGLDHFLANQYASASRLEARWPACG